MVYEKRRWWTSVLLLIIVIGAAGCGDSSSDAGGTASETPSQDSQSEREKMPEMTSGQRKALRSAQTRIDISPNSKKALILLLSRSVAEAGDGHSKADATFAANNVIADWNAEALESARMILKSAGYSRGELRAMLIEGEGFTPAQVQYAVNNAQANWNEEAVESATSYRKRGGYSRDELIQKLIKWEEFTPAQARYAVNKVY